MNHEEAARQIRERFHRKVEGPQSLFVEYPNAPVSAPQPRNDKMWARFSVVWGESFQADLGTNTRDRHVGMMVIQIFSPIGLGDGDAIKLADVIKQNFRKTKVSGITWRTPSLGTVGRDEQWWQTNVSCPFYFDELEND
jgi:hypothetical protein